MSQTGLGKLASVAAVAVTVMSAAALAHADEGGHSKHTEHAHTASGHAPIGVMGDHRHRKGELMLSYRYMHMNMSGSRIGTNPISPTETATTIPNRFAGAPMQPPTLRVVPTDMTMEMHMVGAMYGLTDDITLLAMTSYQTREMDHVTFQGGRGTTELGRFTTRSPGFGDTTLGALIGLDSEGTHQFHLNAAVSIPTGSISRTDQILAPIGATSTLRLPYPMQLGSGTFDLKPGLTYLGCSNDISWGAQGSAVIRLGDNSADYSLGNRFEGTAWFAKDWSKSFSTSARVKVLSQESIDGIDARISGPVQTADPDNIGGDSVEMLIGANFLIGKGPLVKNRLAFEFGIPVYRKLNGPQLETDWTLTVGWQRVF